MGPYLSGLVIVDPGVTSPSERWAREMSFPVVHSLGGDTTEGTFVLLRLYNGFLDEKVAERTRGNEKGRITKTSMGEDR